MKKYLTTAFMSTFLVATIFTGCYVFEARESQTVQYSEPVQEYYWVHDGRVYERDRPGNFYVYENNRRGSHIQDTNYTIRIEKEGKRFRNYREANEHIGHNRSNYRNKYK